MTDPLPEDRVPAADKTPVVSGDLSTMVAVDFEGTDTPERCGWCPSWRFEWVDLDEGPTVLREWHLPDCSVVTEWEETDPEVLSSPLDTENSE